MYRRDFEFVCPFEHHIVRWNVFSSEWVFTDAICRHLRSLTSLPLEGYYPSILEGSSLLFCVHQAVLIFMFQTLRIVFNSSFVKQTVADCFCTWHPTKLVFSFITQSYSYLFEVRVFPAVSVREYNIAYCCCTQHFKWLLVKSTTSSRHKAVGLSNWGCSRYTSLDHWPSQSDATRITRHAL